MSSSPQEKQNLRKRLQKLFDEQQAAKKVACGKSIKKIQKLPDNHIHIKKNKRPQEKQVTENNVGSNKITSTTIKKQEYQKKNKQPAKNASKLNEFSKETTEKTHNENTKKSKAFELKNDKQKESKVKQETLSSTSAKTKENKFTKKHSPSMKTEYSPQKNNKMKMQDQEKSKPKNTENMTKEAKGKDIKNTAFTNLPQRNPPKSKQVSTMKPKKLAANNYVNLKNQKQKATKRTAQTVNRDHGISGKKQKLNKNADKQNKIATKFNQKHETRGGEGNPPFLQFGDEYDVNGMTGHVGGGDFDSDYEVYLDHNHSESEHSSESISEGNNIMQKFIKNARTNQEAYDHSDSSAGEEDYFSSDDDDFDHYYSDSEEEEEDNYSDYDENDYEEDEDSYNYSTEDEEYSCNFNDYCNGTSFDIDDTDSDEDYEMPKYVPEDLIIHTGTATKRDLKPEENVYFNSETECQIIELEGQETVKVIYQPKAYEREELLKLKYEDKRLGSSTFQRTSSDPQACPKLVPIIDEDGFQRYNSNEEESEQGENEQQTIDDYEYDTMDDVSLGSEYTEINSDEDDSLLSEDINDKYLNRNYDDVDSDDDDGIWRKKHKVDVIDASGYKYENKAHNSNDDSTSISLNDDINQLPSLKLFENVNLKTECNILSTSIIDKEIITRNDNIDKNHCAKSNERISLENSKLGTSEDDGINELQLEKEFEAEQSPKVAKTSAQRLVGYKTRFFNAFNSNLVMVLLKDPFYIYGTVRLTLLAGTVEVYGHSLVLNTEVEMFSPRGCSVIEISSSKEQSNISNENLKQLLKSYEQQFALTDLKKIIRLYNCQTDAVVLLRRNESRKKVVQQFKKFMNENVFPNIDNLNVDRPLYNSEYILRCMINTSVQEQNCLRLPKEWQQLNITLKSRVMLTGGKSVGKSTLLRYLINRHLPQQILLIDLDIGQPEVFIPQTISCTLVKQPLLGPGFLLNMQPEISYAVGHTNILLCAHKYIAAVRSLIAYCKAQDEYKEIPWLINTMGYNKGFGLELISVIAREMPLTDIIQLQSNKDINNFDSVLYPHVLSSVPRILFAQEYDGDEEGLKETLNYRLHVWQSAVKQESRYQKEWNMSSKDIRFAIFLTRLSEALQGQADWLTDLKPFRASLNDLKIVNLIDNTPSMSVEQLVKSIEANLVYLCHYEEDFKPLKCLGIGVVRAIDFHVHQLYLIPALPQAQLKDVNCLAIGEFSLSTSIFTNQGSRVKNIAPFVYNTISANASKAIKQIYHRPRKFLTGKHKPLN